MTKAGNHIHCNPQLKLQVKQVTRTPSSFEPLTSNYDLYDGKLIQSF